MSRPRATSNRCVISQPVRRKTDAEATGTNQFDATGIFCGKLLHCPVSVLTRARSSTKSPENRRLSSLSTVKRCPGMAELRGPPPPGQNAVLPIYTNGTDSDRHPEGPALL